MVSTTINSPIQAEVGIGVRIFNEQTPVQLWPKASTSEIDVVIRAIYRQVLGNAHVMESERLTVAESQLKCGDLSVREFVRLLAKSDVYRTRFFDTCYRYRAIELNFKHLLGRAPDSFDEMRSHSNILDNQGFEADIDAYLDSDEYQTAFGEWVVPYCRGRQSQLGQSMLGFTNLLTLLPGASGSDKNLATNNSPQLTTALIKGLPYGRAQAQDVGQMLSELLASQPSVSASSTGVAAPVSTQTRTDTSSRSGASSTIEQLKKELSELQASAGLGAAHLGQTWQSVPATTVDALKEQVADARRYAAIGKARANRWRSRLFKG